MRFKLPCPHCQHENEGKDSDIGLSIRCGNPKCRKQILVSVPTSRPFLLWTSFAWVLVGWFVAWSAPAFSLLSPSIAAVLTWLPIVTTTGFILANLRWVIQAILRAVHVSAGWPFMLAVIALFHLLFFQIACHLGAQHFHSEQQPQAGEWMRFTLLHTFRAGDVFDTLEAYGVHWQAIQHTGTLMTGVLIVFHFILSFFFVAFGVEQIRERFSPGRNRIVLYVLMGLLIIVVAHRAIFSANAWRTDDLYLWPLDSLIRVVDGFDAIELAGFQIHSVPKYPYESTLTFLFRVLLAALIAKPIGFLGKLAWVNVMRVFGYRKAEMRETLNNMFGSRKGKSSEYGGRFEAVRQTTAKHAPKSGGTLRPALAWSLLFLAVYPITFAMQFLAPWNLHAVHLAEKVERRAANGMDSETQRMLDALARMGSYGEAAIPRLVELSRQGDLEFRSAVIATLGFLGPQGLEPLGRFLADDDQPEVQLAALTALENQGARGTPILLNGLVSKNDAVRAAAQKVIDHAGNDAVKLLAGNMTPDNRFVVFPLIYELAKDPYWRRVEDGSDFFREFVSNYDRVHSLITELKSSDTARRKNALTELVKLGPVAAEALPEIIQCIAEPALSLKLVVDTLAQLGPEVKRVHPRIVKFLGHRNPRVRERTIEIMVAWTPIPNSVTDQLINELTGDDVILIGLATERLPKLNPEWRKRPPARKLIPELIVAAVREGFQKKQRFYDLLNEVEPLWETIPESLPALPQLVKMLTANAATKEQVLSILTVLDRFARPVPDALPAFVRIGESDSEASQILAIRQIGRCGESARVSIPMLMRAVVHSAPAIRDAAGQALLAISPTWVKLPEARAALPDLAARLRDAVDPLLSHACGIIVQFGDDGGDAVPELLRVMQSKKVEHRRLALQTIRKLGRAADSAIPVLIELFGDPDEKVRTLAVETLTARDPNWAKSDVGRQSIDKLIRVSQSSLPLNQTLTGPVARSALLRIGPPIAPAVTAHLQDETTFSVDLVKLVCELHKAHPQDADLRDLMLLLIALIEKAPEEKRYRILESLVTLDAGPEIKSILIRSLTDTSPRIRSLAIVSLTKRGTNLLSTFGDQLKDPSPAIRLSTLEVIDKLRAVDPSKIDETMVKIVRARLLDTNATVATAAAKLIPKFGPIGVGVMVEWLDDTEAAGRMVAVRVLSECDPKECKKAIPGLILCLKDPSRNIRLTAIRAMSLIGPPDFDAIEGLTKILTDKDPVIRASAVLAITANGKAGSKVIPTVAKLLDDPIPGVRAAAVESIGQLGKDGNKAIPLLIEAGADIDPNVRSKAWDALNAIDPKWLNNELIVPAMNRLVLGMKAAPGDRRVPYSDMIGGLATRSPLAMQALVELVVDSDFTVRGLAWQELNKADAKWFNSAGAKKALTVLRKGNQSNDPVIRASAEKAIRLIGN